MQFAVKKKALVKMLKAVYHRDRGAVAVRNKNQWLRMAAQNGTLELLANGFSAGAAATVTEEGVAFVWYSRMLEIVQSYKTPEITVTITPAGMKINTFETGRQAWFAIFDKPSLAPESMEAVYKDHCPPDPNEALDLINLWREMRLRAKPEA